MTIQEAEQLYRKLFIAFPHMHRYLNDSALPDETLQEWCKMLAMVEQSIGEIVVQKWKSGEIDPPDKPWELGLLPLKIRAIAGRIADDRAKAERQRNLRSETEARHASQGKDNLGRATQLALYVGEMRRDGVITEERNAEIMKSIYEVIKRPSADIDTPADVREWLKTQKRGRGALFANNVVRQEMSAP